MAWMAWEMGLCAVQWQAAILHAVLASAWMVAAWARLWAAWEERRWWMDKACDERCGSEKTMEPKTRGSQGINALGCTRIGGEGKQDQGRERDRPNTSWDNASSKVKCDNKPGGVAHAAGGSVHELNRTCRKGSRGGTMQTRNGTTDEPVKWAFQDGGAEAASVPAVGPKYQEVLKDNPARPSAGTPNNWPSVTLILPVHGLHQYSVENFQSALRSSYVGRLQAIFVSAHADDAGLLAAGTLIKQARANNINVKLLEAKQSVSCSQKLHNMMEALKQADGDLLFFLDDDVCIQPHTVERLAEYMCRARQHPPCLRERPPLVLGNTTRKQTAKGENRLERVVMVTGYPLDVPAQGANLAAYCKMGWHMPLLVGFSVGKYAPFVWGGCMMIWQNDIAGENGRLKGLYEAWSNGGYSDDLIAAAWCLSNNLLVAHPSHALLPMRIEKQSSWFEVWNYLHRQMYVLDTYADERNHRINHTMLRWQAYLSAATIWPLFTPLLVCFGLYTGLLDRRTHHIAVEGRSFSTSQIGSFWFNFLRLEASSAVLCVSAWMSCVALWCMLRAACLQLEYSHQSKVQVIKGLKNANWFKVMLGFWICQALVPIAAIVAMRNSDVRWGGTIYRKKGGKVTPVSHVPTQPWSKHSAVKKE